MLNLVLALMELDYMGQNLMIHTLIGLVKRKRIIMGELMVELRIQMILS